MGYYMLYNKIFLLCHHISPIRIQVDRTKIEVILKILVQTTQKDIRSLFIDFLGNVRYYKRFIEKFTKIPSSLFQLLTKDVEFY